MPSSRGGVDADIFPDEAGIDVTDDKGADVEGLVAGRAERVVVRHLWNLAALARSRIAAAIKYMPTTNAPAKNSMVSSSSMRNRLTLSGTSRTVRVWRRRCRRPCRWQTRPRLC